MATFKVWGNGLNRHGRMSCCARVFSNCTKQSLVSVFTYYSNDKEIKLLSCVISMWDGWVFPFAGVTRLQTDMRGIRTTTSWLQGQPPLCPNMAVRWLKISLKAACPLLGALWISYSLQAAIITTTNRRPLSRALFCSASRLFQPVIRILLIASSSFLYSSLPTSTTQNWLFFLLLYPFIQSPFHPPPPPIQGNEWLELRKDKSLARRTDCWMLVDLSKRAELWHRIEILNLH